MENKIYASFTKLWEKDNINSLTLVLKYDTIPIFQEYQRSNTHAHELYTHEDRKMGYEKEYIKFDILDEAVRLKMLDSYDPALFVSFEGNFHFACIYKNSAKFTYTAPIKDFSVLKVKNELKNDIFKIFELSPNEIIFR